MAKVMKHEHEKERGALATLRERMPLWPPWMERIDELVGERWSPFWPMLREELAFKIPLVDVYEEGNEVVVKAELPGMKREDIRVDVTGELVTLSGTKEKIEKIERKDYHRMERSSGSFSRTVRLPAEVDIEKVTAHFVDGVLEIRAPVKEAAEAKVKKVPVT